MGCGAKSRSPMPARVWPTRAWHLWAGTPEHSAAARPTLITVGPGGCRLLLRSRKGQREAASRSGRRSALGRSGARRCRMGSGRGREPGATGHGQEHGAVAARQVEVGRVLERPPVAGSVHLCKHSRSFHHVRPFYCTAGREARWRCNIWYSWGLPHRGL